MKKGETKEIIEERKISGIIQELEKYRMKLQDEAVLCHNEALRALMRFRETEEMEFRINSEVMDAKTFLLMLAKILSFDIPARGIRSIFAPPSKRLPIMMDDIAEIRNYLSVIRGARKFELPELYKKIEIKNIINIRKD